jgi:F0F1-type ATP synthase assembly protein I
VVLVVALVVVLLVVVLVVVKVFLFFLLIVWGNQAAAIPSDITLKYLRWTSKSKANRKRLFVSFRFGKRVIL